MKDTNENTKIVNIVSSITSVLLVVFSISLIFVLFKIGILKLFYILIISTLVALFDALLIINIENKKNSKYKRYVINFVSIGFITIYLVVISSFISTYEFMNKMTTTKTEYQTYLVLSNTYNKIGELDKKTIGFVSTNKYLDDAKNTLGEQANISFTTKDYENNQILLNEVYNKQIDAITLENSYMEIMKESNEDIFNNLKIIYKYKLKINKKNKNKNKVDTKSSKPFILYISGSDSRGGISETARSDVNIVAVVNPNTNKILLVSIPRDYYVQLHGTTGTKDKLTHAGVYGIEMSENTINDLLDINIDYYLKVGFQSVIKSVDLVGGIDIYSDKTFTAHTNRSCSFEEGRTMHVNGDCALAFSRERYAYTTGDRHRGENQQQVITKMIEKFSKPSVLRKYNDILSSLDGSFETDMNYAFMSSLIKEELTSFARWNVESISLDGSGDSLPTYSMGSQKLYVMIPDESTILNAKEKINLYLNN